MGALLPLIDAIQTVLEAQDTKPYFSQAGIQAIESWRGRMIIFEYADLPYIGARFIIKVRVF
jgi:hypothetical protein